MAETEVKDKVVTVESLGELHKYNKNTYIPKNQGVDNNGKFMGIVNGQMIPVDAPSKLPQAQEDILGGIKAKPKTTESIEVTIDIATGKLYVPDQSSDVTAEAVAELVMLNYVESIDSINGESVYNINQLDTDLNVINGEEV